MGFTTDDHMVRVEVFKHNPRHNTYKWYTTESVSMEGLYHERFVSDAVRTALERHFQGRCSGMVAVVLDPHSENEFPQMMVIPNA